MRMPIALLALGAVLLTTGAAVAQGGHAGAAPEPPPQPRSAEAAARYPQLVRVGDLMGRQVLENVSQQRVLGRVAGVTRGTDDLISIRVVVGGLLGIGTRQVALPVAEIALLGPFLVALALDARQLAALPDAPAQHLLPADAAIRIGLARN